MAPGGFDSPLEDGGHVSWEAIEQDPPIHCLLPTSCLPPGTHSSQVREETRTPQEQLLSWQVAAQEVKESEAGSQTPGPLRREDLWSQDPLAP